MSVGVVRKTLLEFGSAALEPCSDDFLAGTLTAKVVMVKRSDIVGGVSYHSTGYKCQQKGRH